MRVRVDLHVHTSASFDCRTPPAKLWERCRALGLGPVFVTDRDTIAAAEELTRVHPREVVMGQEVTTTDGEIIGLFLTELVPRGLNASQAVERIRAQGGLVYLEHPYDHSRRCLDESIIERVAAYVDIVEVFNGRSDQASNRRAEELCVILRAAPGAGSDAHTLAEIGSVQVEMEAFSGPMDFLAKLREGSIRHPGPLHRALRSWLPRPPSRG